MSNSNKIHFLTTLLKQKKLLSLCLLAMLWLPHTVMARCAAKAIYASLPSEVILDTSVGIGGVMGKINLYWPDIPFCSELSSQEGANGVGTPSGNLYPTPFAGISYRIYVPSWTPADSGYFPYVLNIFHITNGLRAGNPAIIELVKTGSTVNGGTWPASTLFATAFSSGYIKYYLYFSNAIQLTIPTCTITNPSISFSLDEAETKDLTKTGNVSKERSFLIPINCPVARNLSLQFSGDMADSTRGVYRNQNGSSANRSTLGIQVLFGSTGVRPGVNYNIGVINGFRNIGMSARYYALSDNVAGGPINSTAYATIIYN